MFLSIIRFTMRLLLVALALLWSTGAAQNSTTKGPCDLTCHENATCVPGNADFSEHPRPDGQPLDMHVKTISDNGWRCDCPEGKTGLLCGRTYIGCSNPEHKCYNGGKCIPGVADRFGNTQDFCDCGDAVDKNGVHHVGKYCEIPAPKTCDDEKEVFCVNGGYCKEDWMDQTHRPCRCGPDHDGQHCEYDKGKIPECTMKCQNGGNCELGIKNYKVAEFSYQSFWKNSSNDFMHCVCPDGFFGLHCEVKSDKCGDHHCFNGGTCVTIGTKVEGGIVDYHCDCTTAKTEESSYAGRFCQYESTNFCDKTMGPNGLEFCVNGGTCKAVGDVVGCDCPDGFHGPICEFNDSEDNKGYEECTLECLNGGECRKGAKDVSFLDKFNLGPVTSNLNMTHNEDFEHCVCPDGFVGHTCEIEVDTCGENEHICLYGSKCVEDGEGHKCDCEGAYTELVKVAGNSCQHKSTEFCTSDGKSGVGVDNLSFCVNNGTCVEKKDGGHPGCNCPSGFSGPHCEVYGQSAASISSSSNGGDGGKNVAAIVISILIVGGLGCGVAFAYRWRWSKSGIDKNFAEKAVVPGTTTPGSDPQVDVGPEKDLDGNELENVEII